jgi:anaerobic ribonucleoside-triphosphate reductase activating protein
MEVLMELNELRVFKLRSPVYVLGPYARAVIWLQGCDFECKGCIVPESWDRNAGEELEISEIADWILDQSDIEGITLSGGEPMLQAEVLSALINNVREERDIGVVCYTGFRLEHLNIHGIAAQKSLLEKVDLLIDGVYIKKLQGNLLWRGSSNQRILILSNRYRDFLKNHKDRSAGVEFYFTKTGEVGFSGVPAKLNFRQEFESRMYHRSVIVNPR